MSEPRLEDISDYDTLKGEKKKIVWTVILVGLLIGVVYTVIYTNDINDDAIKVEQTIKNIPIE